MCLNWHYSCINISFCCCLLLKVKNKGERNIQLNRSCLSGYDKVVWSLVFISSARNKWNSRWWRNCIVFRYSLFSHLGRLSPDALTSFSSVKKKFLNSFGRLVFKAVLARVLAMEGGGRGESEPYFTCQTLSHKVKIILMTSFSQFAQTFSLSGWPL